MAIFPDAYQEKQIPVVDDKVLLADSEDFDEIKYGKFSNFVGPKGDKGDQGDRGLKGNKGDIGPTGSVGPQGAIGPQGIQGEQGVQGVQGITGAVGATGSTGPQGVAGEQGPTGDDGTSFTIKGAVDIIEDLPSVGNTVGDGYFVGVDKELFYWTIDDERVSYGELRGLIGPQGPQGVQGTQGIQGEAGEQGIQGVQGTQGIQGEVGEDGANFVWEGTYAGGTTYHLNDVVSYNGNTYICLQESTGNLPTNGTYRNLMASKGLDGEGAGDMLESVYDPTAVGGDTFDMDNMVQGTNNKFLSTAELTVVQATSGSNTGDQVGDGVTITGAGTAGDPFVATATGTGDVIGPATNTDGNIPQWNGADSKTLKDGLGVVTTLGSPGANTNIPTEAAVRAAITGVGVGYVSGPASSVDSNVVMFDGVGGKTIKDSGVSISGSNTGDETESTIKTKLGITTLSGTNTGDQSASDFNHDDLSNITGTVGEYNHPTDAQMVVLGNTSNTNTGDEVVATGAEVDTGTDDAKFATAKALKDSHNVPSVSPSTSGNIMQSDGTDWTSVANTAVKSTAGTPTGADRIIEMVSLTTAEYAAISGSEVATTLYIITD